MIQIWLALGERCLFRDSFPTQEPSLEELHTISWKQRFGREVDAIIHWQDVPCWVICLGDSIPTPPFLPTRETLTGTSLKLLIRDLHTEF